MSGDESLEINGEAEQIQTALAKLVEMQHVGDHVSQTRLVTGHITYAICA